MVTKVYVGRLTAANLEDSDYVANLSEKDIHEKRILVNEGLLSEQKVLDYTDTLLTAVNTRLDPVNPFNAEVPIPHSCSTNVSAILNDQPATNKYYEVANCVQRHACRPAVIASKKKGGSKFRFNYHFDETDESRIVFKNIGTGSVRAKCIPKINDKYLNVHNRSMLEPFVGQR